MEVMASEAVIVVTISNRKSGNNISFWANLGKMTLEVKRPPIEVKICPMYHQAYILR